jgi:hypothetical protein
MDHGGPSLIMITSYSYHMFMIFEYDDNMLHDSNKERGFLLKGP